MLRLILGRAGTGKTGQILAEIRRRVESHTPGSFLIVPEQYSHEAERELAAVCGDSMCLYAEVLSFTRLAHRVAAERGGARLTYMDRGGRLLELALALDQVGPALRVYGAAARQPETMAQLLSALEELRLARADSASLLAAAETSGGALGDKLRDLAMLQEALDAVAARSGAGEAERLEVLAASIPESAALKNARIYIDGFTDFTAQERAVIRALWSVGDVTVCLGCDDLYAGSEVFSLSRATARRLREAAEQDGVAVQIDIAPSWKKGTALGFLEENLFGYTPEVFDAGDAVRLLTAPSAAAECELAAGEIRRLVRQRGCRWRDVAVAVRGFGDYRSVLEETFRRYEIPLYTSARTDIFTRPLPALVGAAFDILSDGWSYESMFSYLKTGLTGISRSDCDELENYVLLWSLRGTAWTREAPWRQHPDGFDGKDSPESAARLSRLDALRRQVAAPLQKLQRSGAQAGDALGQCRALAAFWDDIALPERLSRRSRELRAMGEEQSAAEYEQLWERIVSAPEQCAAVLGDMPMSQEVFGRLFRRMLSEYDVGTIPVALDRVTAGDFDRMRRRRIKHLFVLGATDERLPRIGEGAGVFTDPERDRLRDLRIELADSDDILDREFSLIYNVFTLPEESLTVIRPAFSTDGSELRPSFVAERLEALFGLQSRPGDLTGARRSAPRPALELACAGDESARAWWEHQPDGAERLRRLREAGALGRGRLGREAVRSLYGDTLWLTASRIDNLASCKFQYFIRYGLKAKPRQKAEFAPPELGKFLHFLLENVARAVSGQGGFAAVTDETVTELTDRFVAEYVRTELQDFREKNARFIYLFRRLTQTARRVVLDTARELRRSDFRPLDFELDFSRTEDLPAVSMGRGEDALMLTGVADRVDGWEHDGKLYLRVVDYKSGHKQFSLTDVWYGMGLQMLLYLFALEKNGEAHYKKPIVPAGVLYVPARDVLLSTPEKLSEEEIVKEKSKKLRRSGLLLSDTEVLRAMEHSDAPQYLPVRLNREGEYAGDALATASMLSALSRYIESLLGKMAGELRRGSIAADPWFRSENENACLNCDYFDACHFDENAEGWHYKAGVKAPEFWQRLEEREKGGDEHASDA